MLGSLIYIVKKTLTKDFLGVFEGLKNPFTAVRYHSLVIDWESLPEAFRITAWSEDEEIMGVEHVEYPAFGL